MEVGGSVNIGSVSYNLDNQLTWLEITYIRVVSGKTLISKHVFEWLLRHLNWSVLSFLMREMVRQFRLKLTAHHQHQILLTIVQIIWLSGITIGESECQYWRRLGKDYSCNFVGASNGKPDGSIGVKNNLTQHNISGFPTMVTFINII